MTKRQWYGLAIFILSILLWFTRSDTLKLVLREREVLFNRYSEGHFGVLFIVTLLLWVVVGCLWSKRPLDKHLIGDALTGVVMTIITILGSVYLTHWMTKPRYIETNIAETSKAPATSASTSASTTATTAEKNSAPVVSETETPDEGIIRHRPPNTVDKFTIEDKPERPRSYPNPPKGFGSITGTLTTDSKGFRNLGTLRDQYDIVITGDSFAAGSHVSDEQVWTLLLEQKLGKSIYNLGASGTAPITYLNNYQLFGIDLKPSISIFVIYEGNDFKADGIPKHLTLKQTQAAEIPAQPQAQTQAVTDLTAEADIPAVAVPTTESPATKAAEPAAAINKEPTPTVTPSLGIAQRWDALTDHIILAFKASPITRGLKVVSQRYFETAFATDELNRYGRVKDVMPMKVTQNGKTSYYAFDPKRLQYLFYTEEEFRESKEWQATAKIIQLMAKTAIANNSKPIFIYVPSTPHVVMPFAGDLPAKPLARFLAYVEKDLPKGNELIKKQIFERLDSEENVFMQNCLAQNLQCLSLTPALQQAMQNGVQTYYSYDQHWTPEGNKVAAETIANYLSSQGL
jgi:hypothetical protein